MRQTRYENIGETLYTGRLDNGLRIKVLPKRGFNKSYAFFATDYGGADRRFRHDGEWIDTPAGVAHFLEHKMFDMPEGVNVLNLFSSEGASPDAFTSSAMTAYHFECTDGFYRHLETLLSFVSVPYFTPESVAKEQGIIGQEICMTEDDPDFALYFNLLKCLTAANPARDSVCGTAGSIAEITPDTLYYCHRVFYAPSNMALCCVGDIDPDRVEDLARRVLPPEPGETPERDYGPEEPLTPCSALSDAAMEVSAPRFLTGAKFTPAEKGEARHMQELTSALALDCLMGRSSPLYSKLYADGLIKSDFSFGTDLAGGMAAIIAGGECAEPDRFVSALTAEVAKTAANGFDGKYFARAKKAFTGALLRGLDSFPSVCCDLAASEFAGYCPLDAFALLDRVSAADAAAFVAENLAPERLALSVVRPAK